MKYKHMIGNKSILDYDDHKEDLEDIRVGSAEIAYRRLMGCMVREGAGIEKIEPINNRRYMIVKTTKGKFLFLYKRAFFMNFGRQFRKEGYNGIGDTINCKELVLAKKLGVDRIYSVFSNGAVYTMGLDEFLEKSIRWENKEGKGVRSISVHEYTRAYSI